MLHPLISHIGLVTNMQIYDTLSYEQDSPKHVRYQSAANIYTYMVLNDASTLVGH